MSCMDVKYVTTTYVQVVKEHKVVEINKCSGTDRNSTRRRKSSAVALFSGIVFCRQKQNKYKL